MVFLAGEVGVGDVGALAILLRCGGGVGDIAALRRRFAPKSSLRNTANAFVSWPVDGRQTTGGFYMTLSMRQYAHMGFEVRLATDDDRAAALALAFRLEEGVSPWRDRSAVTDATRKWVAASIGECGDDRACFVAEQAGRVVGFISVGETTHWSGTHEAYIGELMVAEAMEGRGIGRALVRTTAEWARIRRCRRISLDTGAANSPALAFYESLGFEHDEVRLSRAL